MAISLIDEPNLGSLKPIYSPSLAPESSQTESLIQALSLLPHIEGGYFSQTDEAPTTIPSPYPEDPLSAETISLSGGPRPGFDAALRRLSTTIFYLLTHRRPLGRFHRNRSRIIHTLHRGRGRYVLLHPDGRVETFVVGHAVERGEKLQWVVEGGVWKASYLLDTDDNENNLKEPQGLLISETVVPGFEFADHEFLSERRLGEMLPKEQAVALAWLSKKNTDSKQITDSSEESDTPDANVGEPIVISVTAVEVKNEQLKEN
ncbi:RmlC-like cupin domain-containing protein [Thelonectria olida]|uniref:RmlC-like cupin domain-containing protein n=1 Tax=Thelonectria olida TaxID=1576542 RepID=A0A9P8WH64_9HYPO|nr:RmlC-like cupin domain-containing protein [Thelonectria olida]